MREFKQTVRAFLALYEDNHLAALLVAARAGSVTFAPATCCIMGRFQGGYHAARATALGHDAERAYLMLGFPRASLARPRFGEPCGGNNALRNRILVAMVRAEIRRRTRQWINRSDTASVGSVTGCRFEKPQLVKVGN